MVLSCTQKTTDKDGLQLKLKMVYSGERWFLYLRTTQVRRAVPETLASFKFSNETAA